MARKVLIVEDEIKIARWLRTYFEQADFQVTIAGDGLTGLSMVQSEQPDIAILDINLPGMDGLQLCQKIRQHQDAGVASTPIIMLTARLEEADRLRAFGLGADDYVPKPFSPKEVVARAQAIFRRLERNDGANHVLKDGELMVEPEAHIARLAGEPLDLTPNEFAVLVTLLEHRGQVLSRSQLIELAMGYDYEGQERTVDVYVRNLRRKIEADPANPRRIVTVFGVGYRYEA